MLDANTHAGTCRLFKKWLLFSPPNFPDTSNLLSYCLFYKKAVLTSVWNECITKESNSMAVQYNIASQYPTKRSHKIIYNMYSQSGHIFMIHLNQYNVTFCKDASCSLQGHPLKMKPLLLF